MKMGNAIHMPSKSLLKNILVGKSIVLAEIKSHGPDSYTSGPTGYLTLSDGMRLKVWGNDGGCMCSSGCYPLTFLNECDNVITNVSVEEHPGSDYHDSHYGYYRIFVWAEERRVNLASFEGTDGNGYYGTGWWLTVESEGL